jgi:hypothetical protein
LIAPLRIGRKEDFTTAFIKPDHQPRQTAIIGGTGGGKTNMMMIFWYCHCLIRMAKILIDPSGSFARDAYSMSKNAIYCSIDNPVGINPLMLPYDPNDIVDIVIEAINQVITVLTENVVLTSRMRSVLREAIVWCVKNNRRRFDQVVEHLRVMKEHHESRQGVIDRLLMFIQDERMNRILCEMPSIDIGSLIEKKQSLIVDCHGMNEDKMVFVGTLLTLMVKTYFRFTRKEKYDPLALYIDECHNFVNQNTFTLLREGRKYSIISILATTDFAGMSEKLVHTILSNCGTLIAFRCGFREAVPISKEFRNLTLEDVQFLEKYHCAYRTPDDEGIAKTSLAPFVKEKPILTAKVVKKEFGLKWFKLKPCRSKDDSEHQECVSAEVYGQETKIPLSYKTDSYL